MKTIINIGYQNYIHHGPPSDLVSLMGLVAVDEVGPYSARVFTPKPDQDCGITLRTIPDSMWQEDKVIAKEITDLSAMLSKEQLNNHKLSQELKELRAAVTASGLTGALANGN